MGRHGTTTLPTIQRLQSSNIGPSAWNQSETTTEYAAVGSAVRSDRIHTEYTHVPCSFRWSWDAALPRIIERWRDAMPHLDRHYSLIGYASTSHRRANNWTVRAARVQSQVHNCCSCSETVMLLMTSQTAHASENRNLTAAIHHLHTK